MRKVMRHLQRSVSLAISHSQVAFSKVDTAEGVKVNLEQLLLAILPLIIIIFFLPLLATMYGVIHLFVVRMCLLLFIPRLLTFRCCHLILGRNSWKYAESI